MSRCGSVLPQMKCSSMAEYIENIRQDPALGTTIKFIFKNTGGVRMNYQYLFNPNYTIQTDSSDIEMVYFSVDAKEAGDQVKTAADVLMYMLAAKIADSNGCKCTPVGGHTWHWNMSAMELWRKSWATAAAAPTWQTTCWTVTMRK